MRTVDGLAHNDFVRDSLGRIQAPALIVFGEDDRLIPNPFLHGGRAREVMEYGHADIRGSELVGLDRCGHSVQLDCPQEYNDGGEHVPEEGPGHCGRASPGRRLRRGPHRGGRRGCPPQAAAPPPRAHYGTTWLVTMLCCTAAVWSFESKWPYGYAEYTFSPVCPGMREV